MIVAIDGKITKKEPTSCFVKCASGVTYKLRVSLFTSTSVEVGQSVELLATQIFREDAQEIFGFLSEEEQKLFEMLLKVSGVGPSTALAVCSTLKPDDVSRAVNLGDESAFKRVPGVGPKGARMIIAQLKDAKFDMVATQSAAQRDAFLALQSLGFKEDKIGKTLAQCTATETAALVKEALSKMK